MASIDKQSSSTSSVAIPAFIKRRNHNHQHHHHRTASSYEDDSSSSGHENNNNSNSSQYENNSQNLGNTLKLRKDSEDSYSAYRRLCEARMRRLERYKKARSFCSLHDENGVGIVGFCGSNDSGALGSENAGEFFSRSQRQQPHYRRAYDGDALNNNTRVASSSCSHLTAAFDNDNEDGKLLFDVNSLRHSNCGRAEHNRPFDELPAAVSHSELLDASTTILPSALLIKPATDPDSICVDSEETLCGSFSNMLENSKVMCSSNENNKNLLDGSNNFIDKRGNNIDMNNNRPAGGRSPLQHFAAGSKASPLNLQFEILREKMISIMENDVQLLKKLLTLGETIQEIRGTHTTSDPRDGTSTRGHYNDTSSSGSSSRNSSDTNNSDEDSDEIADEWRPLQAESVPQHRQSAVTRLYVGGDADRAAVHARDADYDETEEDKPHSNVQYFSRKNSVLRIPIPPRSSNRMLGKRPTLKPSELMRHTKNSVGKPAIAPTLTTTTDATTPHVQHSEDSGHSSASNTPPARCSPSGETMAVSTETITEPFIEKTCRTTTSSTTIFQENNSAVASAEMAIFALRSELKASLMNGGAKTKTTTTTAIGGLSVADSGCSTLIQCSSSSASSSDCGTSITGGSSRYSTFSTESFSMVAADNSGNMILDESRHNHSSKYDNGYCSGGAVVGSKTILVGVDEKCGGAVASLAPLDFAPRSTVS